MHFRTARGIKIQKLFEIISPLLVEGNLIFDKDGIHLGTLTLTLYCQFHLKADALDEYKCDGTYQCGVHFGTIFRYLKSVAQDDAVSFQLTKNGHSVCASPFLYVHIITSTVTYTYRYRQMDIEDESCEVPHADFETVVRIPSVELLRALRSCEQVPGDAVQFLARRTPTSSTLYVVCDTELNDLQITIHTQHTSASSTLVESAGVGVGDDARFESVVSSSDKPDLYSLKHLSYIAKAACLSPTVTILLKSDYALVLRYRVGTFGYVTFALAPRRTDDVDGFRKVVRLCDLEHTPSQQEKPQIQKETPSPLKKKRTLHEAAVDHINTIEDHINNHDETDEWEEAEHDEMEEDGDNIV